MCCLHRAIRETQPQLHRHCDPHHPFTMIVARAGRNLQSYVPKTLRSLVSAAPVIFECYVGEWCRSCCVGVLCESFAAVRGLGTTVMCKWVLCHAQSNSGHGLLGIHC